MRVLITNDDGVDSPGLTSLARVGLAAGHDVVVAAPNTQYSGASASVAGHEADGRVRFDSSRPPGLPEDVPSYAVRAAPALITYAASCGAFGPRPDVVLSGVNWGANTGLSTLYSGTVGAALSAAAMGIPAIAVSLDSMSPAHWATAEAYTARALDWLLEQGPLGERVLNLNVPDLPEGDVRGLRQASLATFGVVRGTVHHHGDDHVLLGYVDSGGGADPDSDAYLLAQGWATLTLLRGPTSDPAGVELPEFANGGAG